MRLLAATLELLPGRFQLPIPLGMDLLPATGEHVLRRDVVRRAVQSHVVVVVRVTLHQTSRMTQRQRCSRPDALPFGRFVPALDFPVRLTIVGRSSDGGYARDPK
jgi:hypothetical protein